MRCTPHIPARVLAIVGALASVLVPAAPALAAPDTPYVITGKGWGHGIGLSQYGAMGFANHGYSAQQIITYYFQGTTVGAAPAGTPTTVNVELQAGASTTRVQVDADGASLTRDGSPAVPLQTGDVVAITAAGPNLTASVTRGGTNTPALGAAPGTIVATGPDGSLAALGSAVNGSTGHHYRGSLIAVPDGAGHFDFGNRVSLESYLLGVVPAEVPSSWPDAALQAQAIAARSYAIATKKTGAFDMWADTRSQMYLGIEHEAASTSAAVSATGGQVALYDGAVIPAFFSSTSGGRTASIQDVWTNGAPKPYLTSVPDPYEVSPYSSWTPQQLTAAQIVSKLGGGVGTAQSITVATNASQRASSVTIVGSAGSRTLSASSVQVKLGLRSTYFRITPAAGVAPARGRGTISKLGMRPRFGKPFVLRGKSSIAGAELWQRNGVSGAYVRAAKLPVRRGAWSLRARIPRGVAVRQYQLRIGGVVVARLSVRPRLH
jgi:stage II sporulation protein D